MHLHTEFYLYVTLLLYFVEADVTVRTQLRHGPGGAVPMYCQSQLPEGNKYLCLDTGGQRLPGE